MSPFELAAPSSIAEALALLSDEGARPLSGGTALMLMMKAGVLRPPRLVSLRNLGLAKIEADGSLRIGSLPARCARCRTSGCATWRPWAARWRTPIRTWTCRRFFVRWARAS
jgi:CO/xanthine dehydrogenase FAD-binding subunit